MEHLALGHDLEEIIHDPGYPCYSELGFEKLHAWNIRVCYQQLKRAEGSK
jgi:hypothetical protein